MRGDEERLKTADEEPRGQEQVALVAPGFSQGLPQGLVRLRRVGRRALLGQRRRHGHDQPGHDGQQDQRLGPAVGRDQELPEGHHQELAAGAAGAADAEVEAAPFGRRRAADDREHQGEAGAAHGYAGEKGGAEGHAPRVRGHGHEIEPGNVGQGAQGHHPAGAVAVRQPSQDRLRHTPDEALERHGEREDAAGPAEGVADGDDEQAVGLADAEGQHHHQGAADENDDRGAPGALHGLHES